MKDSSLSRDEANSDCEKSSRQRLLEAGVELLAQQREIAGVVEKAASQIGCSTEAAKRFFECDSDLVHAMYARVTFELEERTEELPSGIYPIRFAYWMKEKFAIANRYRSALASIALAALDDANNLGVWNAQTESIRSRNLAMLAQVWHGSINLPVGDSDSWIQSLYELHLTMMFAWCLTDSNIPLGDDQEKSRKIFQFGQQAISLLDTPSQLGRLVESMKYQRNDERFAKCDRLDPKEEIARRILTAIFKCRRIAVGDEACLSLPCEHCYAIHLPRVRYFVYAERPIRFILPAFPAKSPSRSKTLGPLPDRAEEIGLESLVSLCQEIQEIYPPGASIVICSDGHVFGDCVGITDAEVVAYSRSLNELITSKGWTTLSLFDMRQIYETSSFDDMRQNLLVRYAMTTEELERKAASFPHQRRMVDGIHRFLFEELVDLRPDFSRSHCRNLTRSSAYETVRRSDAWSKLLADIFPYSLRLSIHPQSAHSQKIGILLGSCDDIWLTPWHAVAVKMGEQWKLMKAKKAVETGAGLVYRDGRPSYFESQSLD